MRKVCIYRKTALWRYRKTKGIHWIICKRCWRTIKAKAYTAWLLGFLAGQRTQALGDITKEFRPIRIP